jgi:uncharacterized RDD family membrane protein YckC/type II secretory pathway pseudopilin PulG
MNQYWIGRNGQQFGPFAVEAIRGGFAAGKVLPTDLVWTEGMAEWTPAAALFGAAAAPALGPAPAAPGAAPAPAAPAAALAPAAPPAPAPAAVPGAGARANPYQAPAAPVDHPVVDSGIAYGGFWARLAASFIDGIVIFIPLGLLSLIPILGWIGAIVLAWLYFALMESGERGASLGKRALNLQVLSADGLERIGFGRATGRFFGRYLSTLILYIGYLMQPFTARKQALHDMISGTVVVARGPSSGAVIAVVVAFFLLVPVGGILAAIAIPAYQDYTVRAKVSNAILGASGARTAVHEYVVSKNRLPRSLRDTGYALEAGNGIKRIALDPSDGELTIELDFAPVQGKTISFMPSRDQSGQIVWASGPGTIPPKYLPKSCRPD